MKQPVQMGAPVIVGDQARTRELVGVPAGVTKWRIRHRGGASAVMIPKLYMHYSDGSTEEWIMGPVGSHAMKPLLMQGMNARGQP